MESTGSMEGDGTVPRLVGLDHVQLLMPLGEEAEQSAEEFYGRVLGLDRIRGESGGCWFSGPCVTLHLAHADPFTPSDTVGAALLVNDIDAWSSRLAQAGMELRVSAAGVTRRRCGHTEDPFGNRLELIEVSSPTPEMFEVMANQALYPLALLDPGGTIRWTGASIECYFGYSPEELVGKRFDHVIAPDSLDLAFEAFANIDDADDPGPWGGVGVPIDLRRSDGSLVTCELVASTLRRTGLPWYLVEIRLAGYERALDHVVEAMAGGANLGEMLARIVRAIQQMVPEAGVALGERWTGAQFGVSAGNATHLLTAQVASPWAIALATGEDQWVDDLDDLPRPLAALARAEGYVACWVHPVAPTLGEEASAAIVLWRRHPGRPSRFMWNTVRRAGRLLAFTLQWDRSHSSLAYAATHDPMTGVGNRQAFRDRLERMAAGQDAEGDRDGRRGDAEGSEGSLRAAVLYIDLDRFKPVNDELGHLTGDRVLTIVAERLMGALRLGDMVARMGGDEFAVLCERLTDPQDVAHIATRLIDVICRPIVTPGHPDVELGASIGVVEVQRGASVDALLARADEAMRAAKGSGGNRWRLFQG